MIKYCWQGVITLMLLEDAVHMINIQIGLKTLCTHGAHGGLKGNASNRFHVNLDAMRSDDRLASKYIRKRSFSGLRFCAEASSECSL